MTIQVENRPISIHFDPWDSWQTRKEQGQYELTSVEFTVTHLCNLRCEHCAVGDALVQKEGIPLPLEKIVAKLDQVSSLTTISITGGEPVLSPRVVNETIRPLLRYAKSRGIYTQINTNLTLPLSCYEEWIEDVDVLHISYNYRDVHDFHRMVFQNYQGKTVPLKVAEMLYDRMKTNAVALSEAGVFISAESFLSPSVAPHIVPIHYEISEMGCRRHEVHPLYPSDFACDMKLLSLQEYKDVLLNLMDHRDMKQWILLGTLPFFPCSDDPSEQALWLRIHEEENVTVRQDPDGRNRVNVNMFTGEVRVTDFADAPPLGNMLEDDLTEIFTRWLRSNTAKKLHCFCEKARCAGPNLLVADTYYPTWDFRSRNAHVSLDV